MELNFERHEGTQETMPLEVEVIPTCVYVRKNIHQEERNGRMDGGNEEGNESEILWAYDEAKIPHNTYVFYALEKQNADILYISMMSGINLHN